jgi:citrate lyase beta subunit
MRLPASIDGAVIADLIAQLSDVDARRTARYPGPAPGRQPVHTCYLPADRLTPTSVPDWGARALAALDEHAPNPATLASVLDLPANLAEPVYERVRAKLRTEPVEDLRVDFEDGYGAPGEQVEDDDAHRAVEVLAGWCRDGTAPASMGLRFKSFDTPDLLRRGIRTLDLVLTGLVDALDGLPARFVPTFPKVTSPQQVSALIEVLELLEDRLDLGAGTLRFEIQIETTQSVVDDQGRFTVPRLIAVGQGRVAGLHFGTYDYTAACGLGAVDQHLAHPACDFARAAMQVGAAGTGVLLCDGSTNILPVGDAVHDGWRTHFGLVSRSLHNGFFQGWDLHPAQLVTRYAAVYAYYLAHAPADAARLKAYVERTAGSVLDEPATAQALATSLRRAVDCGALTADETGFDAGVLDALAGRRPVDQPAT